MIIMKVSFIYFNLILVNLLFSQTGQPVSQIDTTWWYDTYSNGLKYIDNNELDNAENEFRKILDRDDTIAHSYYGLGLVYFKREEESSDAIDYFEEAIDLNPDFIESYYYLGLVYEQKGIWSRASAIECFHAVIDKNPHFVDAWIAWARIKEKVRWPYEVPFDSEPLEILANGLKVNPGDPKLYQHFKDYLFWYSYEELSVPTFKFLIQRNPSRSEYALDFAQVLYHLDQYESCLKILDSIEKSYSNYSSCNIFLLHAKIFFHTNEETKGLDAYWQAIDSIGDTLEANVFFSDLWYIINNSEFEEYQSLSIADLPDFYARFWRSRDPNLATQTNERIAEYYKRLKYAWKNYRRYFTELSNNKIFIYKSEHPLFGRLNISFGDEFLNPFVSDGLPAKRALDDAGLIYIRHGEPDNFAIHICGNCAQNLSWKYSATYNRQEIIFHFRKYGDSRGWMMESLPGYFENRGDFGGHYAQFDPTNFQNRNFYENIWRYEELNEENIENAEIGVQTETSDYSYENPLIDFPIGFLSFKGENSKTTVDWFYKIEGTDLQLDTLQKRNHVNYSVFIGIFDTTWHEISRLNYDNDIPLDTDYDEWQSSWFIDSETISVPPGSYNCEFQLADNVSDNLGVFKGMLDIPDYWKNELMLSDIILSGPVSRNDKSSRFKKGDVIYNPHMFTAYSEGDTVGLYFEIYNLLYDFTDRTDFEITWSLKEADEDEDEPPVIKSTVQYSGETRDDKIYLNIDLSDTDSDDYELEVLVKDVISEEEASQEVRLSID
jgi:GWxTD domain-containing protein